MLSDSELQHIPTKSYHPIENLDDISGQQQHGLDCLARVGYWMSMLLVTHEHTSLDFLYQ